jgi:hypothetical protein
MKDWNDLSEAEKLAVHEARIDAGHTSVARYERRLEQRARANAFDEAIGFLEARGFGDASAALEAAAFERVSA